MVQSLEIEEWEHTNKTFGVFIPLKAFIIKRSHEVTNFIASITWNNNIYVYYIYNIHNIHIYVYISLKCLFLSSLF